MFVFVDVETTGLDPEKHELLEVGITITRDDLNILTRQAWVLRASWSGFLGMFEAVLASKIAPVVKEMHTKNNLFQEVSECKLPLDAAEDLALGFLHGNDAAGKPMCGSSVHFDRAWLKRHMPRLEDAFHYRNVDVSTLKNLFAAWAPAVAEDRPRGEKRHRALPDIQDTIAELAYYREHVGELAR